MAKKELKVTVEIRSGRWGYEMPSGEWRYYPPGWYTPGVIRSHDIVLQSEMVRQLITALDEEGWIIPRLDERLRAEDLKITHRLFDLLEKLSR